jgi:hypothetical protein
MDNGKQTLSHEGIDCSASCYKMLSGTIPVRRLDPTIANFTSLPTLEVSSLMNSTQRDSTDLIIY